MIKFNKAALAVLALGASSVASAAMYEAPPGMMQESAPSNHGVYLGIGAGGIGFESQVTHSGSTTIVDQGFSDSVDGGNYGLNGYLLAGYAWTFPNKVFLAGEIFGTLTNAPVTINTTQTWPGVGGATNSDNANVGIKLDGTYGVRLLPGYQVTPSSVVYGIIGYSRADTSTSSTLSINADGEVANQSTSDSFWFNGLQLGLGSMISVTDHIALRGDLIWTGYQSQTIAGGSTTTASGNVIQDTVTAQPTTIEADVGLIYMFD